MDLTPPLFRWLPLACVWLCLASCVSAPSGAAEPPHGLTEIVLERDCFGCANAGKLVLRSDGSAVLTEVGKARHGTTDRVQEGWVTRQEFDALARLLVQRGFFRLADRYGDPELQDGAWTTVRAVRGEETKEVFVREDASPPELRVVETAIDALRSRIRPTR
jgi:hypothetical protein